MKVILFGSTGNLGLATAIELKRQGYELTAVARNKNKSDVLSSNGIDNIVANVEDSDVLVELCTGYDVVISTLGKSVSPNDRSKPSFYEIDYVINSRILDAAKKSNVKKIVYVSAFHAEKYQHLSYFKVHHDVSMLIQQSGMDYSIIKPPAIFSAFIDMIELAAKGRLMNIGIGDKKTNPIYEGDLARIVVNSINQPFAVVEVGGNNIYSRKQLNEIVQQAVDNKRKVRRIPMSIFKILLRTIAIFDRNTFDKFAFFAEVMQHDAIAPRIGKMRFEDYIKEKRATT